jgi:pyrroline-5-carboxylate reductase
LKDSTMKLTFIGGGNMARAMIGGLVQQGWAAADISVVEIAPEARRQLEREYGVAAHASAEACAREAGLLLLAVKPQQMRTAALGLRPLLGKQLAVTIAAGITIPSLSRWLGGYENIVRAMPNTPALVRAGITGLYAAAGVSTAGRDAAQRVMGAVGETVWVEEESQLDTVTALSGSGPAYVFYLLQAMEEAGQLLGLPDETVRRLSQHTVLGAAKLAVQSAEPPAALRARVTSKGGTTEAALARMEAAGVKASVIEAIRAAAVRSQELGRAFGETE